ncbi:MAG: SDR family NAD(P)-dependent oxidoreductase [Deltaproteobacteria bacterium]|nr:SDR family NAD(P)-dependent oxidoreductase [Deltaproteobacteria bacterium]
MKPPRGALITGGSTGIGLAIAKQLARRGTRVALCARTRAKLDAAAAEIRAVGGDPIVFVANLADPNEAVDVVRSAREALGQMDMVIANAGIGANRHAARLAPQDILPTLQLNMVGACTTLVAAIPHLVENGGGHLVGISSIAGYRGLPGSAAYSASKAGLSTFLESLRVDLRRHGVKVTDIRPGFVKTPLTDRNRFWMPFLMEADTAAEKILRAIERGRPVYTFPWPMMLSVRLLSMLPNWLYDRIGARIEVEKRPPSEDT